MEINNILQDLEIHKVAQNDKIVLLNLMQLYIHDITLNLPNAFDEIGWVNQHGLFDNVCIDKYFELSADTNGLYPYFIKSNCYLVGFALLDRDFMVYNSDSDKARYNMAGFFILNAFKNKGIGKLAANKLFDLHRGEWEIRPCPKDIKSKKFWHQTISQRTNSNYEIAYPKSDTVTFLFTS